MVSGDGESRDGLSKHSVFKKMSNILPKGNAQFILLFTDILRKKRIDCSAFLYPSWFYNKIISDFEFCTRIYFKHRRKESHCEH